MNTKNTNFVIASPDVVKQLFAQLSDPSSQINEQSSNEGLGLYERQPDSHDVSESGEAISTYMCNGTKYISRLNTARLIGVAPSTLWHWQQEGILVPIKYGNKKVHYRYDDVIALLNGSSRTHENH